MRATKTIVLLNLNNGRPKWWAGNPLTGEIAWGAVGSVQVRKKDAAYIYDTSTKKARNGYVIVTDALDARLAMEQVSEALRSVRWVPISRLEEAARLEMFELEKRLEPNAPPANVPKPELPAQEIQCKVGKSSIASLENDAWF